MYVYEFQDEMGYYCNRGPFKICFDSHQAADDYVKSYSYGLNNITKSRFCHVSFSPNYTKYNGTMYENIKC